MQIIKFFEVDENEEVKQQRSIEPGAEDPEKQQIAQVGKTVKDE